MKFSCFGGAAAVADEAVAAARHRRGKFLFGSKAEKSASPSRSKASSPTTMSKRITSPDRRMTDFDVYMMAAGKSSSSSSSASALSTAASLDSAYSSSMSSSLSSSRSSSSNSLSSLEASAAPPQPAARKRVPTDEQRTSPALGAAAVLVCLVMMVFGGRLVATLLTAAVLCFFPRQCRAYRPAASSPASRREAETIDTKAVTDGFLVRNRKKGFVF